MKIEVNPCQTSERASVPLSTSRMAPIAATNLESDAA
jgi:hypothetical protein